MQQAVGDIRAVHDHVVGQNKAAGKGPGGNAAMQIFALTIFPGNAAGDDQGVFLDGQLDVIGRKTRDGKRKPVGVIAGFSIL
jgi:hypothetical protein